MPRLINSRRLTWVGHVARLEEGRNAFKIFTANPTENRPLGRSRRRLKSNIRIGLKEISVDMREYFTELGLLKALVNMAFSSTSPDLLTSSVPINQSYTKPPVFSHIVSIVT